MCEGTAEGVHAALGGAEHLGVLALHPTPEYMIPGHVEDDAARGLDVHQLDRLPGGEHRAAQIHGEKPVELLDAGKASRDRKSTRLNSSHGYISYAVFCLKKKIS